jgi:hypothetical protein
MKFYKTEGDNKNDVTHYFWDGTQADAAKRRKALKATGYLLVLTEEVEVPTDKAGLLAYLNVQAEAARTDK